jgi:GST-like protein
MLEELGEQYNVHPVNIGKGEQYTDAFVKINPNSKIPAIVDHEGPGGGRFTLFESGAILFYLAEKHGRFFPPSGRPRYHTMQWLMFQMGGPGPIFGQVHHFLRSAPEPVPYAIERYSKETRRLYGVLNAHLANNQYLEGDYSIADIGTYPWVARFDWHKVNLEDFPNVKRWFDEIGEREAVQRGMGVPSRN